MTLNVRDYNFREGLAGGTAASQPLPKTNIMEKSVIASKAKQSQSINQTAM